MNLKNFKEDFKSSLFYAPWKEYAWGMVKAIGAWLFIALSLIALAKMP